VLIIFSLPIKAHDADIVELSNRIASEPDRDGLLLERAQLYRLNGQLGSAMADLDALRAAGPDDPKVSMERALTLSALGRDAAAETILNNLIDGQTGELRWAALSERAVIRGRNNELSLAIEDLNEVIGVQPALQLYLTRGSFQERLGDLTAAAAGYRAGLAKLGVNTLVLKERLIAVEIARGNYAAALDLVEDEIARVPVKTPWLLRRAELLDLMGWPQQAEVTRREALDEANRVLARRSTAINRLARAKAYIALDKNDDANCDLQLIVEQAPQLKEAQDLLADVQWKASQVCTN